MWGGSFALLLPWGMVWWGSLGLPLRPFFVPLLAFYGLWCVLLPLRCENRNLGFLRLWMIVPIRTVFGTMAVLVGSMVAVAVVRNFAGVVIGTGCVLADRSWSASDDKWIGVGVMNKRTRAIDEETYKLIIATMKNGFAHEGVQYKPNERIATVLVLEYNLGLRVGDILNLTVDSFVKDGSRYRLDIYEQKSGKYRNFTVVNEIYQYVRDYAYAHNISSKAKLFPITERAVLKHLKAICAYLGVEGVASHSFRKGFATNVYVNNHYNIELVRVLLQHSSVNVTQRYIGIGSKELEDAIQKNICLG